jgi:hypothetical protein
VAGTGAISSVTCLPWQDSSFGGLVAAPKVVGGKVVDPGNTAPTWCGPKTDEMQYIDVYGCTAGASITLRVIHPNKIPGDVTFACDATASAVQAAYGTVGTKGHPSTTSPDPYAGYGYAADNSTLPPTYSVHVNKSTIAGLTAGTTGTRFTIGYWDPSAIMSNWWEPIVISKGSASMTVVISTKQEGGYVNAVTQSSSLPNKPSVLPQVMSLFISTAVVANTPIGLTWTDSSGVKTASVTTNGAGTISSGILVSKINAAASLTTSTGVANVSIAIAHGSAWNEYRITFAPSATTTYFNSSLAVGTPGSSQAFVTTYTNYNNYPWFYDYPYGYSGSGRCVHVPIDYPLTFSKYSKERQVM